MRKTLASDFMHTETYNDQLQKFNYYLAHDNLSFEESDHIKEQFIMKAEYKQVIHSTASRFSTDSPHEIVRALSYAKDRKFQFILIVKSYHDFPPSYRRNFLEKCIHQADQNGADVLLGGAKGFVDFVGIDDDLFWIDFFKDSSFFIIYNRFYDKLIYFLRENASDSLEKIISQNSKNILLLYPFVSFPREFKNSKPNTYLDYYLAERAMTILQNAKERLNDQ